MRIGEEAPMDDDHFPCVPRYDVFALCGNGAFVDEAPIVDKIPFTNDFMRKKLDR